MKQRSLNCEVLQLLVVKVTQKSEDFFLKYSPKNKINHMLIILYLKKTYFHFIFGNFIQIKTKWLSILIYHR